MKLLALLALTLASFAHAETQQYCSPTTIVAAISTVAGKSQASLASTSTISQGACTPTPPQPTGCTKPPIIASTTPGIASFTRWIGMYSVSYFGSVPRTVDVTSFDSLYWAPWPGKSGITAILPMPINKYASFAFTVPAGYMAKAPDNIYGQYWINPSSSSRATISATISTSCGDFSHPNDAGSTVVTGCWRNKVGVDTAAAIWTKTSLCALKDGQTYYLNIINADINLVTPNGGTAASTKTPLTTCSTTCNDPIANISGNWPTP
jgi:hypothetical protein